MSIASRIRAAFHPMPSAPTRFIPSPTRLTPAVSTVGSRASTFPGVEPFRFRNPGRLIDRELELVTPALRWVEPMLRSSGDDSTVPPGGREPMGRMSRRELLGMLSAHPDGRDRGQASTNRLPAYHFWMRLRSDVGDSGDVAPPTTEMAGSVTLRVGESLNATLYLGHFGYGVFPAARGHGYARRACRLLLPLARQHGMTEVWITTNPGNHASRRTAERLGAVYVDTVELPVGHPLHRRGERHKCRYLMPL